MVLVAAVPLVLLALDSPMSDDNGAADDGAAASDGGTNACAVVDVMLQPKRTMAKSTIIGKTELMHLRHDASPLLAGCIVMDGGGGCVRLIVSGDSAADHGVRCSCYGVSRRRGGHR